ncbi:MAG: VWA domain-containing protein [Burkholderiaceae bacterium]|jgi:Ca-activated chloride channel family protein|nr:VWA domain-containing protein [Burkholderiaceae bacterium]
MTGVNRRMGWLSWLAGAMVWTGAAAHAQAMPPPKSSASAVAPGQSMLVLDASGSMWGQISGRPKIEIARDAVDRMLASWPQGQQLGLMAYGHRSKGDCADIELLRPPGPVDRPSLMQAVRSLQPKGMTPISASVRLAAEQLKYSERKATVVLVSDGEETCQADPCAVGRQLEQLGVDFTAHVIGFDIAKGSKAEQQLRCLASSTGGRYLDARDAASLNDALRSVSQAQPAPKVNVTDGREWLPDTMLWWEAGTQIEGGAHARESELGVQPLTLKQTARDCQAMCMRHPACGAWVYNPTGSYFIDHPRCDLKGTSGALRAEKTEPGEGWVSGVKPGARIMYQPVPAQ